MFVDEAYVSQILQKLQDFTGERRSSPQSLFINLDLADIAYADPESGAISLRPVIRHLLGEIGIDERRIPALRLEHKLIQGIVMRQYRPDAFLETMGLGMITQSQGSSDLRTRIESLFPFGYCIKAALGYGSSRGEVKANNDAILKKIDRGEIKIKPVKSALEEQWVVQREVAVVVEYKVHTIEEDVITGLTHRYSNNDRHEHKKKAEAFVADIIRCLPNGLIKDSFCSWDVALSRDETFKVLEINYSGVHRVYDPGYHCSGVFQLGQKAPPNLAVLISHLQRNYGVNVKMMHDESARDDPLKPYLRWVEWWARLLTAGDMITELGEEVCRAYDVRGIEDLTGLALNPTHRMFFNNLRRLQREVQDIMLPSEDW